MSTLKAKRRRGQQFIVVVPEAPSFSRQAFVFLGAAAWKARQALAPTGIAIAGFVLAAILHAIAWWSCFLLAPLVVAPMVWLSVTQRSRPARGTDRAWRIGFSAATACAAAWLTAAALRGPLSGPLDILWLLALIGAQTAWLVARRTR